MVDRMRYGRCAHVYEKKERKEEKRREKRGERKRRIAYRRYVGLRLDSIGMHI